MCGTPDVTLQLVSEIVLHNKITIHQTVIVTSEGKLYELSLLQRIPEDRVPKYRGTTSLKSVMPITEKTSIMITSSRTMLVMSDDGNNKQSNTSNRHIYIKSKSLFLFFFLSFTCFYFSIPISLNYIFAFFHISCFVCSSFLPSFPFLSVSHASSFLPPFLLHLSFHSAFRYLSILPLFLSFFHAPSLPILLSSLSLAKHVH